MGGIKYKIFVYQLNYLYGGENSKTYSPGQYLDITVIGADNKRHYSSGVYYITKVNETISSDGYIQNLTLFKNPKALADIKSSNTQKVDSETDESKNNTVVNYTPFSSNWFNELIIKPATNFINNISNKK